MAAIDLTHEDAALPAAAAQAALPPPPSFDSNTDSALVSSLLRWHTSPHNPLRPGKPMRKETAEAHVKRLRSLDVSTAQLEDPHGRQLMAILDKQLEDGRSTGTRRVCCDSVLFYLKFAHSTAVQDEEKESADRIERAIVSARRVRNALQQQYATELKARNDRKTMEEQGKWCDWPSILKATHALLKHWRNMQRALSEQEVDSDEDFDPTQAKTGQSMERRTALAAQAALVALIYTVMPPSRGLELRTLECKPPTKNDASTIEKNWLSSNKNGDFALRLGRYKTVGMHGIQTIPLPENKDLHEVITFVTASPFARKQLLHRQKADHGLVFCHPSTGGAMGSDSWSGYVAQVFKDGLELCGLSELAQSSNISVNVLRKSFLTHALPNAKTVPERESLAAAMRHSTKMQTESYNAATASDRVKEACSVAQSMFLEARPQEHGSATSLAEGRCADDFIDSDTLDEDECDSDHSRDVFQDCDDEEDTNEPVALDAASDDDILASVEEQHQSFAHFDTPSPSSEERLISRLVGVRDLGDQVEYLVHWLGDSVDNATWEEEEEIPVACVREYYERRVAERTQGRTRKRKFKEEVRH